MMIPTIEEADLEALKDLTPDLEFDDPERRAVLLESHSRDINAAPGSGKTSILAAKLLLLARKWPFARRGICVLSHTNVAREEIQRRLSRTVEGAQLLGYPHFIGTIHGFVNQFLALPYLRSTGAEIDVIDDEVFERRAVAMAWRQSTLRGWMSRKPSVEGMIAGLVYRGAKLEIESEGGDLPKPSADSYPLICKIKRDLSSLGIYRHDDMFALAECLISKYPQVAARLSLRFPLVFIDEMQDTSWVQEELLQRIFGADVVMQRLGDVNQRILTREAQAELLTFPKPGWLSISTSRRFGAGIAGVVSSVQLEGTSVTGEAPEGLPPHLILYQASQANEVIQSFGRLVLEQVDDNLLAGATVTALCTRKQSDSKQAPGRCLPDYWPAYSRNLQAPGSRSERFWALLSDPLHLQDGTATLVDRSSDMKRALLLVLRAAKASCVAEVRDGPMLLRRIAEQGLDHRALRSIIRDLALGQGIAASEGKRKALPSHLFHRLSAFLPTEMTEAEFCALDVFDEPEAVASETLEERVCTVEHNGRRMDIDLGTVASKKGETHLATLVLESHGGPSRRFDLADALPFIAGTKLDEKAIKGMSKSLQGQYRNLYVALSRPTQLLCLAANSDRVPQKCRDALAASGWTIVVLPGQHAPSS